jgi:PAS domain S-box-containing protein
LPVIAVATYFLNVYLITTITALESRMPIWPSVRESLRIDPGAETMAHATLVAFGALAALVVMTEPWGAVLLAVPVVALHATLNRQSRLRGEAEHARMMSDAGLAEAQRLANLGSWEWYPATNHWVWSDEAYRLLGLEPGHVVPSYNHIIATVHPDDRERVEATLQRARRTGVPFELEHQVRLHDGTERHVHQRCEARSDNGRGLALFGTIQDVTERVMAARAMEDAARAAQEADRAKTQLLSMASHDLRTPLTAIQGYIELVHSGAAGELNGEQRELLEVAYRNANDLAALISDLLDLARLEAGGLQLRREPSDIAQSVKNVLRTLAPAAAAKDLALDTRQAGLPPIANADPARLSQILLNVVGNAVKFTDQGKVTVKVNGDRDWVTIVVADTGSGIPAEALPHIFEEFSQGGEAARRKGGAGLGLAIVKQLVELHGGTIGVESAEGIGTTFTIRLPADPRFVSDSVSEAAETYDQLVPARSLSPAH